MDNVIHVLASRLETVQTELADTQTQLENARTELVTPFAREEELAEKIARLNDLNFLLNMDEKDKTLMDDGPEEDAPEPPRARAYERQKQAGAKACRFTHMGLQPLPNE